MSKYLKILSLLVLINISSSSLWSQVVWPGDVNNNGIVNNVDWVYLWAAVGEVGPPRPVGEMGIEWEAKSYMDDWGASIPGLTLDQVFADCDGSGVIDGEDFVAIDQNYGLEHGIVDVDVSIPGDLGVDPRLFLNTLSGSPFPQGTVLFLELNLGTEDAPVSTFNGLAFTIEYDPDVVFDIFFIPTEEDEGDWSDAELIAYERHSFTEGKAEFAFSPLEHNAVENAFGLFGRLFIVIEDDVVGMQDPEMETEFLLEDVILFGEDLVIDPIVNDTISVTIVADPLSTSNFLDPESVEVFPNPASDHLYLKTEQNLEQIELYNTVGQILNSYNGENSGLQKIAMNNYKAGVYFLKIYTNKGILTKKVFLN